MLQQPVELPPVPMVSISTLLNLKDRIRHHQDVIGLLGEQLTLNRLKELQAAIQECGKFEPVPLWTSLLALEGRLFTDTLTTELAWRLAANRHRMKDGLPALPWTTQLADEWMAFQITEIGSVRFAPKGVGNPVLHARVVLKCLVGSFSPGQVLRYWTMPYVRLVASRMGFDRGFRPRLPMQDFTQMFGMRLWGWVEASRSAYEPRFHHIEVPGSFRTTNRDLLKMRARLIFRCPKNYPVSQRCHACPIGLDQCPAATHRRTYVFGPCSNCRDPLAAFDGSLLLPQCVTCTYQKPLRKKT